MKICNPQLTMRSSHAHRRKLLLTDTKPHLGVVKDAPARLPQKIAGIETVRYLHLTHRSLRDRRGYLAWAHQGLAGEANGRYDAGHQHARLLQTGTSIATGNVTVKEKKKKKKKKKKVLSGN